MAEKDAAQLAQIITLLNELKGELQVAKADIRWLKRNAGFGRKPPRKRAIITLPESYEIGEPSIELSADDWTRIKRGETLSFKNPSYEICEDVTLCLYWEFSGGGIGGTVKLSSGLDEDDDKPEIEYEEKLIAEYVEEIDEPSKKRR